VKVLFFNYEYPPLGGGASKANLFLFKEFGKMNNLEVDLVTSSSDPSYHLEKIGENIRVYKLPIGKTGNGKELHFQTKKDLLVYSWKAFWFGLSLLKMNKFDLSHSFFTVPCGFLSLIFNILYGLPYIVSLRGSDVPGYSERFDKLYKFLLPLVRLIWKKAEKVIANSEGLKELAEKVYDKKQIRVIMNGVDTEKFDPEKYKDLENEGVGAFRVICGTRVTARKGLRYLIGAVEKMKNRGELVLLDIIGEGDEKDELEALVREKGLEEEVNFLGVLDHDDVPKFMAKADIFVSPSLNEGMANAMLEALAMGLPLVATNIGGTKELIEEGVNGLIVETQSEDDLVSKILQLKNDPELKEKMSRISRERALKISWQDVASAYHEAYQEVAKLSD
jgi:glycosyltransferase involved in cell wall biosynthesis